MVKAGFTFIFHPKDLPKAIFRVAGCASFFYAAGLKQGDTNTEMSDFIIPGVTSNIDTAKMIKALMDVEKVRLEKMREDVETYNQTKKAWQDLNLKLSRLKDSAATLYGFQNPFNERIAESSDTSILTATANRAAVEEEKEIIVKRMARADKFISGSQAKDFKVESGTYTFRIGETAASFRFNGGTLKEFAQAINTRTKNLLKASVVNDTTKTQVLIIEGMKTGSKNRIEFSEKALEFGLRTSMLEETKTSAVDVSLQAADIQPWEKALDSKLFQTDGRVLTLRPQAELKLPVIPALELHKKMVLEFDVTIENLPDEPVTEAARPPGPKIPGVGEIIFKGIKIEYEKSGVILPRLDPPQPPEKIEDLQVLSFSRGGDIIKLPQLAAGSRRVQIPIGEYADRIDALLLSNRNTHKIISFENIKIHDPAVRGDYRPVNPLEEAGDAVILMDGIGITRETNEIDDLIPDVELRLNGESAQAITLAIKQDLDLIESSIVNFIGHYNQIITVVDVLSRSDEAILDALEYLEDDEREKLRENTGLLQGELTLMQLKTRLQNIMMNPYPTGEESDLRLLAQLGIATNTSRPGTGTGIDKTKLRGYLQIDEAQLEAGLKKYKTAVKEFFGRDTDGDLIVDTGLAFMLDNSVKPYTNLGGILATKMQTLDTRLTSKNRDIDDYNKHLEDYEAKLKKQYATMEGMLDTLQKNSQAIDNFNKQNSQ